MAYKVVLDAGHGGNDSGATYEERKEKDDVLKLTLSVGEVLTNNGIDVEYTRLNDSYNTPYEKAMMANNAGADLFVSLHRNNSESPEEDGVESLVLKNSGTKAVLANNINSHLENIGFANKGVMERPNLVVLKRSEVPTAMVEVGYINSEKDNELFDEKFEDVAKSIAEGILETLAISKQQENRYLYRVQVGAYRNRDVAYRLMEQLLREGYQGFIVLNNGIYKVQVGAFEMLDNAVRMEQSLRSAGYNTYIVTQ